MVLNVESKYPNRRAYVLKLRGDAKPDALAGRIENLVTGNQLDFASARELLESLVRDLEAAVAERAAARAVEGGHAHGDRHGDRHRDRTATGR